MDPEEVAELIEARVPEAEATVTYARPNDEKHLSATVVSPEFRDRSLVDQHDIVHEALSEHLADEIHALEITTRTPEEV